MELNGFIRFLYALNGGKSAILVNGQQGRCSSSKWGVRQGDHLSSLLFALAADTFTKMVNLKPGWVLCKGLDLKVLNKKF